MSKRRGKNRPPKIGPPRQGAPTSIITFCSTCPDLVPKDTLEHGRCKKCRWHALEAAREEHESFGHGRPTYQFDTGARARARLAKL